MRAPELVATIAIVGTLASYAYLNKDSHPTQTPFLSEEMGEHEKHFVNHIAKHHRMYGTKEEYYYRLGIFT